MNTPAVSLPSSSATFRAVGRTWIVRPTTTSLLVSAPASLDHRRFVPNPRRHSTTSPLAAVLFHRLYVNLVVVPMRSDPFDEHDLMTIVDGSHNAGILSLDLRRYGYAADHIPRNLFAAPEEKCARSGKMQGQRLQQCFDPVPSNLHTDAN